MEYYLLPESETRGNITQSAIKAGYAETTADKQGKRILENSLKAYQEVLDKDDNSVGDSREDELREYFDFDTVAGKIKKLAYQDENKRVAADLLVKILDRLHNVKLDGESETTKIPTINIGVSVQGSPKEVDYEIQEE